MNAFKLIISSLVLSSFACAHAPKSRSLQGVRDNRTGVVCYVVVPDSIAVSCVKVFEPQKEEKKGDANE